MLYAAFPQKRLARAALLAVFSSVILGGCAYRVPEVDPADIPRIEEALAQDPENTDLMVQLGMAQYKAKDYEAALNTLEGAVEAGNETGPALLYLGMAREHFEDWAGARDAYARYLDMGESEPLKNELRKRLELIAQNVLRQQARAALAQEAQLSGAEIRPRSVAILPFGFNSQREDLQPLIYALSDMMITDFAVSNALTVLERAQIQTLLDEMALTEAGYADPGTGARAGRLLGAENVVQGVITTLGDEDLRLDTDVLNIPRSASQGQVSAQDALENLFDMEKDLVFRTLRDVLGVELTPAEEQAIRENRADNILAFLAYGRGLRAKDRGDYDAALQEFQRAQELDPGFGAASEELGSTEDLQDAASTDTDEVVQVAAPPTVTAPPPPATPTTSGTLGSASEAVNPTPTSGTLDLGSTQSTSTSTEATGEQRDPVQESQGSESVTKTSSAQIRIVIKRPGGGE